MMPIAPRRMFAAIVALLLAATCARAAMAPGVSVQTIPLAQGLNNINSIIQSRDGYLWLGAFGGLARYDGVRFKIFDTANTPELQNSRITALFEAEDGTIWIGHETGDLSRLRGGRFETVTLTGSARREPVVGFTRDVKGDLLLLYQGGALRSIASGAVTEIGGAAEQTVRGVTTCVRDGSGVNWILRAGSLWRVAEGKSELVEFDKFSADQLILGIGAARDGGIWVANRAGLRKRTDGSWTQEVPLVVDLWHPGNVTVLFEMRNGTLAAATKDQGVVLVTPNFVLPVEREDGLPPDWVRTMSEDREGNLWVGMGSGGLYALRPNRVSVLRAPADKWRGRTVSSVFAARGNLWIGTDGAGLYRFAGKSESFARDGGPPASSAIWSFAEEGDRLWLSTAENGLYILEGNRFRAPAGLENFSNPVRALSNSSSQNGMLLGSHSGLFKYANNQPSPLATNLVAADIRCIVEQTNGVVWFGMFGGGLGRLENGEAKQIRKKDGLASDFVQALYLDNDGALWIGTAESGIVRFKDGAFRSITTANGLRDNVICHIADDGLGALWISSNAGIMRVRKDELNRCADGVIANVQCLSLAEADGLPTAQCSGGLQPTGCRTSDGSLWFATLKGVVAIDPKNIRTNQLPHVLIEEMRVNDSPVRASNTLEIEPGRQRYDFDFTAISFAAPERVLFKYRLEGADENWVGPATRRSISYSHLAPGDYHFRVMACNSDGAWSEASAPLSFAVLPFFWQTLWFRAIAILASLGFVGLAALLVTRARYRRQIELSERQRGIERERSRIAQDIHDDLGSSLTRIILLSQSARGDLDNPEYAAKDLDRIYDTARNLTRSLDEIVWAVNPRHDTLDSLATYLGKFAQDFLGAANIPCRLDLPVSLPNWPLTAETRHNVFLAFKEALNNAVKYAGATEVRVSLALEAAAFTIAIEDNGKGFDTTAKNADTEDGLRNMRKRLADIGGNAQIESAPGRGTQIRFRVPVVLS